MPKKTEAWFQAHFLMPYDAGEWIVENRGPLAPPRPSKKEASEDGKKYMREYRKENKEAFKRAREEGRPVPKYKAFQLWPYSELVDY